MSITGLSSKRFTQKKYVHIFTLYRTSVIILTPPPLLLTYIVLYPIKNYKLQHWTLTKVKQNKKLNKKTKTKTHTLQKNRQVLCLQRQCSNIPKHTDWKMHQTDQAISHSTSQSHNYGWFIKFTHLDEYFHRKAAKNRGADRTQLSKQSTS